MTPFSLIAIGILSRTLIAFLITFKPDTRNRTKSSIKLKDINVSSDAYDRDTSMQQTTALKSDEQQINVADDDTDTDRDDTEPELAETGIDDEETLQNSPCFKYSIIGLIIWQIATMLIVFIFDIIKLSEFRASYAHYDAWAEFQCLSAILFISSNSQTMAINLSSMLIVYGEDGVWYEWKRIHRYKQVWFVIVVALSLLYLPFIAVFTLPGFFAYIWITVPAVAAGVWLPKLLCCGCKCCFQAIYDRIYQASYEMIMAPTVMVFVYCIIGLVMINTYNQVPYFDSLGLTLTERTWNVYVDGIGNSFENVLRFLCVFLG